MEKLKLTETGIKINNAIEAVWQSGLTVEELEEFEDYINHQETITPLLHPSFIQKCGFIFFDEAKERARLLKPIIKLKTTEIKKKEGVGKRYQEIIEIREKAEEKE